MLSWLLPVHRKERRLNPKSPRPGVKAQKDLKLSGLICQQKRLHLSSTTAVLTKSLPFSLLFPLFLQRELSVRYADTNLLSPLVFCHVLLFFLLHPSSVLIEIIILKLQKHKQFFPSFDPKLSGIALDVTRCQTSD